MAPICQVIKYIINGWHCKGNRSSPFEQIDAVDVDRLPVAEDGDDDSQADGDFCGGDGHNEKDENLTVEGIGEMGYGDHRQIDRVQHQFDAHKDDDSVFPGEHSGDTDAEDEGGKDQEMVQINFHRVGQYLNFNQISDIRLFHQHHGANDSGQEEDSGDFKGDQVLGEEQLADSFGGGQSGGGIQCRISFRDDSEEKGD